MEFMTTMIPNLDCVANSTIKFSQLHGFHSLSDLLMLEFYNDTWIDATILAHMYGVNDINQPQVSFWKLD